jgi:hypothetical protein
MAYEDYELYAKNVGQNQAMPPELFEKMKNEYLARQENEKLPRREPIDDYMKRKDSMNTIANPNVVSDAQAKQVTPIQPTTATGGNAYQDLYNKMYGQKSAAIESSANNQVDLIKQNLAKALATLEVEKSTVKPGYDKAMSDVSNRQFAQTETQKELMAMSGWNPQTSGLAVGEVGKVGIAADQDRANINADLVKAMTDIQRRAGESELATNVDIANVGRQKAEKLAGAAADASMYADETSHQRAKDLAAQQIQKEQFEYAKAQDALANQREADRIRTQAEQIAYEKEQAAKKWDYGVGRDTLSDTRYEADKAETALEKKAREFASSIDTTKDLTQQLADMEKAGIPKDDYRYIETQKARLAKLDRIKAEEKEAARELKNDKNEKIRFDYEKERDKIKDAQWLKQFNESTRQQLVSESVSKGHLSVSQGQLALSQSREAFDREQAKTGTTKEQNAAKASENLALIYKDMMASGNPLDYIKKESKSGLITPEEAAKLLELYNSMFKNQGVTLNP